MKITTAYHVFLRANAVLFALILLFDSGMVMPGTDKLSLGAQKFVASVVGVYASVEPNEINVITAELTRREQELNQREREINARAASPGDRTDTSTFILSGILLVLLSLIILNYVLDYVRTRSREFSSVEKTA